MEHQGPVGVPRRRLLGYAAGLAAGWLGSTVGWPRVGLARSRLSSQGSARVRLAERGGAVWAWRTLVRGRAAAPVSLTVDGTPYEVVQQGDRFHARVGVRPGPNLVVASAGGDAAVATYDVAMAARPRAVAVAVVDGRDIVLDATRSTPSRVTGAPVLTWRWSQRNGDDMAGLPASGELVRIARPAGAGPWYVDLWVTDRTGATDRSGITLIAQPDGPEPASGQARAPWAAAAVVYGVIPLAFGYRGFAAVRHDLGRLQRLGVTTLWMSPVFQTLRFEFGYGVTDYFTIRDDYGGRRGLRQLVAAAHERGIRVLLDVAVNHTSDRHPYFRHAEEQGTRSHQFSYYQRDANGDPVHYFDWEDLPNLDWDNPEVRRWISEVLTYWVRELDVDGYRFDVAWGVRERRPDAWAELVSELRRVKPHVLLLAEASSRDRYYAATGFDLAYDWTEQLGQWAWHDAFADPDRVVERLAAAVAAAPGADVFRFLNNNDTGERFIDRYGLGMTRVAAALLLTLPGVPCIYCGDEVGASFDPYETYGPIDWAGHPELTDWYAALVAVRARLPALTSAPFIRLNVTPAREVLGYTRAEVSVLLNFSARQVDAEVLTGGSWQLVDELSGEILPPGSVPMRPYGARILTRVPDR